MLEKRSPNLGNSATILVQRPGIDGLPAVGGGSDQQSSRVVRLGEICRPSGTSVSPAASRNSSSPNCPPFQEPFDE